MQFSNQQKPVLWCTSNHGRSKSRQATKNSTLIAQQAVFLGASLANFIRKKHLILWNIFYLDRRESTEFENCRQIFIPKRAAKVIDTLRAHWVTTSSRINQTCRWYCRDQSNVHIWWARGIKIVTYNHRKWSELFSGNFEIFFFVVTRSYSSYLQNVYPCKAVLFHSTVSKHKTLILFYFCPEWRRLVRWHALYVANQKIHKQKTLSSSDNKHLSSLLFEAAQLETLTKTPNCCHESSNHWQTVPFFRNKRILRPRSQLSKSCFEYAFTSNVNHSVMKPYPIKSIKITFNHDIQQSLIEHTRNTIKPVNFQRRSSFIKNINAVISGTVIYKGWKPKIKNDTFENFCSWKTVNHTSF